MSKRERERVDRNFFQFSSGSLTALPHNAINKLNKRDPIPIGSLLSLPLARAYIQFRPRAYHPFDRTHTIASLSYVIYFVRVCACIRLCSCSSVSPIVHLVAILRVCDGKCYIHKDI